MNEQEAIERLREVRAAIGDMKTEIDTLRARITELERERVSDEEDECSWQESAKRWKNESIAIQKAAESFMAERDSALAELQRATNERNAAIGAADEVGQRINTALAAKVAAERERDETTYDRNVACAERDDFENKLACLLDHATGGQFAKTSYSKADMYGFVDDYIERLDNEEIASLTAQLAALREDAAALDWLEAQAASKGQTNTGYDVVICGPNNHGGPSNHWLVAVEEIMSVRKFVEADGPTLRAAIAAARTQEGTKTL